MARKAIKREKASVEVILDDQMPEILVPSESSAQAIASPEIEMRDVQQLHDSLSGQVNVSIVDIRDSRRNSIQNQNPNIESGLELMSRGVKALVHTVQDLRHLGIEDLGLPLPKIVVVGDQSTGKSSLIEGMSGIKVPRSSGTCTRCPLEINLTEGVKWQCEIWLSKKYIYEGSQVVGGGAGMRTSKITFARSEGATRARPLGPWALQEVEDFHFATVSSQSNVAAALRLAQLATLNPGSSWQRYRPGGPDPSELIQVKFSPNVVRLNISGPHLPNMYFYDLPGVISVPEVEEEAYLVDLVKNLVKEYIKDESCINLLALTMTDDPANSTASDLIRKVKAEARTVGVLTKPDRVQHGESLEQWVQILNGERFRLGFGYHVVKNNPDTAVDHTSARKEECDFFETEEPWATDLRQYGDQFGTLKLQTFLSHKLTAQIKASLPKITDQVEQKAAAIDAELNTLPEPPAGNLLVMIVEGIRDFEDRVKAHLDGGSPEYPFQKDWNNIALRFREVMAESRPILNMQSSSDLFGSSTPSRLKHVEPISVSSGEEDECLPDAASTPQAEKRQLFQSTPSKRVAEEAEETPSKRRMTDIPFCTPDRSVARNPPRDRSFAVRFELHEIRGIIQDAHIGLPGQIDPKATDRMIKLSLMFWEKPLDRFLDETEKLCENMLVEQIGDMFRRWRRTRFYDRVVEICASFLKDAMNSQRQAAKRSQQLELHRPTAFNKEALGLINDRSRIEVQDARRNFRAKIYLSKHFSRNSKGNGAPPKERLAKFCEENLAKVTDTQLGPDPYSQEVELMSNVRAYYEYAFSRFVDVVCQGIKGELFVKCRNEMGRAIKEEIGIEKPEANERCAILLEVDPENQARRLQLKKEKAKFEKVRDRLVGLTRYPSDEMPSNGPL